MYCILFIPFDILNPGVYILRFLHRTQVDAYRHERQMTCIGNNVPKPVENFDETPFPDYVKNVLLREGFAKPTAIQVYMRHLYYFRCGGWGR